MEVLHRTSKWGEVRRLACPLRRFPFAAPPNCGGGKGTGFIGEPPRPANPVTCFPPGKVVTPVTKGGMHFRRPQGGCKGFRRQRRYKKWRRRRRTSPAGTVSQPIGKPFNGQAKGLLWLTWRSYAGPPQYYIPPEGESPEPACKAKPITGRTLAAQGRKARRLAQPSRP